MVYNRISTFRVERGLSRKELAERIGVNPQTVGYLERGDYSPSVELALKLSEVFEVRVDRLFSLRPFPSLAQEIGDPLPPSQGKDQRPILNFKMGRAASRSPGDPIGAYDPAVHACCLSCLLEDSMLG